MVGYNFAYDSQNSTYLELGYSFSILDIFLGAGNGFYTTDGKFNVVNLGITYYGKKVVVVGGKNSAVVSLTSYYCLSLFSSLIIPDRHV